MAVHRPLPFPSAVEATTKPTIKPYRPKASAKIRIRIMPTKRRGCWAFARTPASPTMPMARRVARVGGVGGRLHLAVDDDRRDEAVDAEHAGHDHWNDGAHDHVRPHHTHRGDPRSGLGRAVGRTEVREDDRGGHPHEAEEGGGRVARRHGSEARPRGTKSWWSHDRP